MLARSIKLKRGAVIILSNKLVRCKLNILIASEA